MALTSDDWHARHARTAASDDETRSPTVRHTDLPENEAWAIRHGHVRNLAER